MVSTPWHKKGVNLGDTEWFKGTPVVAVYESKSCTRCLYNKTEPTGCRHMKCNSHAGDNGTIWIVDTTK